MLESSSVTPYWQSKVALHIINPVHIVRNLKTMWVFTGDSINDVSLSLYLVPVQLTHVFWVVL